MRGRAATVEVPELARLAVVASAVAGRRMAVTAGTGERTYTDGVTVYVAANTDQRGARASVVIQSALVAAGSLDGPKIGRGQRRRSVADRYLTLEVIRACHALGTAIPYWLYTSVVGWYPAPASESVEESFRRACDDTEHIPDPPPWFGVIKPAKLALTRRRCRGSGVPTVDEMAGSNGDESDDEDSASDASPTSPSTPLVSSVVMAPLRRLFGTRKASSGMNSGAVGGHTVGVVRPGFPGDEMSRLAGPSAMGPAVGPSSPTGLWYPEWDRDAGGFRERWCAVGEFDAPTDSAGVEPDHARDRLLRRELAKFGTRHQRRRGVADGDTLDVTGLVEYVASTAAGELTEPRVYEGVKPATGDLGVLVLLDATGSAAGSVGDRDSFGEQRRLAGALASALHQLGDRAALFAFNSSGRTNVRLLRVKGFDEDYDHRARSRLAGIRPMGYTRLGAAVRRASDVVAARAGTTNRLLVVVSDGFPFDDGYEDAYAREDTRHAVEEAFDRGIGCVAISAHSDEERENVEEVWGHAPRARLANVDSLRTQVRPLFQTALCRAAVRHPRNRS